MRFDLNPFSNREVISNHLARFNVYSNTYYKLSDGIFETLVQSNSSNFFLFIKISFGHLNLTLFKPKSSNILMMIETIIILIFPFQIYLIFLSKLNTSDHNLFFQILLSFLFLFDYTKKCQT